MPIINKAVRMYLYSMVILKHILWPRIPLECLTAGYLLSILYSLNGRGRILSTILYKYKVNKENAYIRIYALIQFVYIFTQWCFS